MKTIREICQVGGLDIGVRFCLPEDVEKGGPIWTILAKRLWTDAAEVPKRNRTLVKARKCSDDDAQSDSDQSREFEYERLVQPIAR
jgi:hypothetical protein